MNLPDAQNHPAFAYRPETGEEPLPPCLPCRCAAPAGSLGVLAVQNRAPRHYADDEVEELETVAHAAGGNARGRRRGRRRGGGSRAPPCRALFAGATLVAGIAIGPVVLHGDRPPPAGCWPTTPMPNWRGCMTPPTACSAGSTS